MSEDNIAEIRQRAEKATKAPWYSFEGGVTAGKLRNGIGEKPIADCCKRCKKGYWTPAASRDANFIAHARQDIPNLCDALEVATKYIDDILNFEDKLPDEKDVLAKIDQIIAKGRDGK